MSARANRRRPRAASARVRVAFGNEGENDHDTPSTPDNPVEQTPVPIPRNSSADQTYHQAFFTIHNTTVEVILDKDRLSWSTVTNDSASKTNANFVDLHDVYAVSPINTHWNWSLNVNEYIAGTNVTTANTIGSPPSTLSQTAVLRGFQLHSYQPIQDGVLQEILIIFQSNDTSLLEYWFHLLTKLISEYKPPKHIFVLLNPYAGGRHTRHIYTTKLKPIIERLHYKISFTEIGDDYSAEEAIEKFEGDFDSIDSLVILGGDGTVINVINALIRYLARANRTRLDMEHELPVIPFPLCIIPDGTTNIICQTIHGNIDHCTPLFHLIFNKTMKIDMSAIFDLDYNFVTANFSAGTGYPANVLKYFPRYSLHSPKAIIKKSFAKATANKNLQPIEVEIRYVPATQNDISIGRCYQGCPSCTPEPSEKSDDQVKAYDESHLRNLARLKNTNARPFSGRRGSPQDDHTEKNWKILHQEFLQVAVLTNANLWTFAPQGLAKFGHLGDGLLDLIVVDPVSRKDFLRYVKRNGNWKNQFELPFTKLIKVKELEIELKSPDKYFPQLSHTDDQSQSSQSDDSSNENMSDNESTLSAYPKHQPHPPSAPISEDSRNNRQRRRRINQPPGQEHVLHSSKSMDATVLHFKTPPQTDPYGSTTSLRQSGLFQSLKTRKHSFHLPRPSSAKRKEIDEEKQSKISAKSTGTNLRPARSSVNGKTDKTSFSSNTPRRSSILNRSSSLNESRQTATAASRVKRPCMWNFDFTPYNSPLIRLKCLYRYLSVYGIGITAETRIKDVNYSCFGRI